MVDQSPVDGTYRADGTAPLSKTRSTLTDQIWQQLRNDVLSGRQSPGKRLRLDALKEEYGVGFSTLREALWRLSAEGLVVSNSRKGFQVSPVLRDELIDMTRLRILLEQMALDEAIQNGNDEWEARLLSTFHRLSKYKQTDGQPWDHWHKTFHNDLVWPCRSPVLQQLRNQLHDHSRRYRHAVRNDPNRDDLGEHRALLDACLERNAQKAKALMAQHLQLTTDLVLASFDR
ncbi:MAG: GntR family transcriptional regulator [Rhizobiales bacterium]|nr:GntR family transcriptional regulator [Hyphomicrobiales bacterium]